MSEKEWKQYVECNCGAACHSYGLKAYRVSPSDRRPERFLPVDKPLPSPPKEAP